MEPTHTHTHTTVRLCHKKCELLTSQPEDVTTLNQIKLYNPVCEEAELRAEERKPDPERINSPSRL